MSDFLSLDRLSTIRFRPTKEADEFLENSLRKSLVPGERYKVARLAIARSLHEQHPVDALERGTEMGSAIEGSHLFGEDKLIWACLIADSSPEAIETPEAFRLAVEAHWHRGAHLLKTDLTEARDNDVEFAITLASLSGQPNTGGSNKQGSEDVPLGRARVMLRIGEVSIDAKQNVPVEFALNSPGVSPHMAIMGKIRSGKTRTGIEMARQLVESSQAPILFIDPKGEFVKDGAFIANPDWGGKTFADRFPGAKPIDVGRTPVPLDFLALPNNAAQNTIAQLAISFRDSFQKCIRSKGDVALDNLREVVSAQLNTLAALRGAGIKRTPLSLRAVRDAMHERNRETERGKDSIEAKLNELVELNLFEPVMNPDDFFARSWVVGLGGTTAEAKRLVTFLLMDALASLVIGRQDSLKDSSGHRVVRNLLVIDEAREILSYRHGALSQLLRKAGSKGQVVMLLSQSPEDFDKEEDEFLSQMGTVAVFASNVRSVKSLRPVLGKKIQPEELGDSALGKGVALVKLSNREPSKIIAWR